MNKNFLKCFLVTCGMGLSYASHAQIGIASYYGPHFRGRMTACGQKFNPRKMTAAHKDLPCGTRVRVTRRDTGKSIVVTINDRGPYVKGRVIDLSKAAARRLKMIRKGTARVRITVVHLPRVIGNPDNALAER